MVTILLIAFGLAVDAFAVSISSGVAIKRLKVAHALTIAAFFGGFQAIMPGIGWLAGEGLKDFIAGIDHWVAFGLLTFIGCKMIYESRQMKSIDEKTDPMNVHVLLMLSVATSIDALAVGLTLSLLDISVLVAAVVIGLVTFVLSFLGVYVGNTFGHMFENKVEAVGGLILIGIGTKMLVEHLV